MHDVLLSTRRMVIVVFLAALGFGQAPAQETVLRGASIEPDGFWFQAGGLFEKDTPGVIFGMTKKPGGDRELAYVVLFKHRANAKSKLVTPGDLSTEKGRVVTMTGGIEIDDKKIGLTLTIEIDRATKTMKSEGLVFAGKAIDLKNGRVFLVDLTMDEPKWQQVESKLPGKLAEPGVNVDVREVALRVIAELPEQSEAIRKFLK